MNKLHPSFELTKKKHIEELQCDLLEITHKKTGARILHLANEDNENVFCLALRTTPKTSNGVAHILEHVVLCGSERFPVRDPFFLMQRRSLNTFMNALTGADFTCYPAASQIKQDFYNLLDVYFDAVFHPTISKHSFKQEGWRYEFQQKENKNSPLEYKGIVFNEMKGALANPTSRLIEALNKEIYPNITYGINSGGDPAEIPQLTYEELKAFHASYYHPSRCLFFFYGNIPLEEHLNFLETHLQKFDSLPPLEPIPKQPRFKEAKRITAHYPLSVEDESGGKVMVGMGWLTCGILEQQELLALQILITVLMDTDASPLKLALLRSGFCKQISAFIDSEASEIPVVFIFKGCETADGDALEKVLRTALQEILDQGIPSHLVESAMHQMEFYRSEISGGGYPFGLSLFMRAGLLLQHEGQAEDALSIHNLFKSLRGKLKENPHYYEELAQRYLLNNQHFVRVTMIPDPELSKKEEEKEKAALEKVFEHLSEKEMKEIIFESEQLVQLQEREENVDILPKVTLDDVPYEGRDYRLDCVAKSPLTFYHHPVFTNGIVYAGISYELPSIKEEDLPVLRLFTTLLTNVGCNGRNYVEHLERVQAYTGGVAASLALNLQAKNHHDIIPCLDFQSKALHRHAEPMLEILYEIMQPNFRDKDRLKELIAKQYTALESSLNNKALKYAINLAGSGIDAAGKIGRLCFGIDYYKMIKDLALHFDQKVDGLIEKLEFFSSSLLNVSQGDLILACDETMGKKIIQKNGCQLAELQGTEKFSWQRDWEVEPVPSSGYAISSPVAFTAMVMETIPYVHVDSSALTVASGIMDNATLHKRIREQGGAYGGGSSQNTLSGKFSFYSYRDPNLFSTIKAFKESLTAIIEGDFDEQEIEEAQLEILQEIDAPDTPGSRAEIAYGWLKEGLTPEVRQQYRERLMKITKKQIQQAVEQHLLAQFNEATLVSFASKELLEKENHKLQNEGLPALKKIQTI